MTDRRIEDKDGSAEQGFDFRGGVRALLSGLVAFFERGWDRGAVLLGPAILFCVLLMPIALAVIRPVPAWDQIAYLAAAFQHRFANAPSLHAFAFDTIAASVSTDAYVNLTTSDHYRLVMASDPTAFQSMLGMYGVKWLYVSLLGILVPIVGAGAAPLLVNGVSALLFGGFICVWLHRRHALGAAPVIAAMLVIAGYAALAMAPTPDMLVLAVITATFILLDLERVRAAAICAFLTVLTRPDFIVLLAGLAATAVIWRTRAGLPMLAAFGLAVPAYLAISAFAGHSGWWPHFWFSTFQMVENMDGFRPAFDPMVYAYGVAWGAVRSLTENVWPGLFAFGLLCWWIATRLGPVDERRTSILAAAFGAVVLKFAIFPLHDDRVYLPMLLPALLIAGAALMASALAGRPEDGQA